MERPPRRALRRYVFRALLATIPLILGVSFITALGVYAGFTVPRCWTAGCGTEDISSLAFGVPAVLSLAVLLVLASLYGLLQYRDAGWAISGGRLVARSRFLARTTTVAPRRRLQSRSVVSSPFQRRVRLATLQARVASGGGGAEVRIVDLDARAADTLAERLGPSGFLEQSAK